MAAQVYPFLARELFNASFVSCWTELHEQYQVCFLPDPPRLFYVVTP